MSNIEIILGAVGLISTAASVYVGLVIAPLKDKIDEGKDAREKMDKRLSESERSYISRAEHAEFRAEIMGLARDIGASINTLSHRIETLVDRLAKVEAA